MLRQPLLATAERARVFGRALALSLALSLALVNPTALAAQTATADRALALAGSYTLQSGAPDRLQEAVERAVAPLSFVVRPVARRRLLALNQPSTRVEILVRDDSIVIRYSNQPELRAQRRGAARPWQNTAGETLSVEVRAPAQAVGSEPLLFERYTAEDGTRENRWFLNPSTGQARLEVSIASPRLPSPMKLQLTYALTPASSKSAAPQP